MKTLAKQAVAHHIFMASWMMGCLKMVKLLTFSKLPKIEKMILYAFNYVLLN